MRIATGTSTMRRMICFFALGMLLLFVFGAQAAPQNGTESAPAGASVPANAAASANGTQAAPVAPAAAKRPFTVETGLALTDLRAAEYTKPEKSIRYGGANRIFRALDLLVRHGHLQEADAEIARLAAAPLEENDKRIIGEELFSVGIGLFERFGPLVKSGFFDEYIGDGTWLPSQLAYAFTGFFNKQKTAQDKLRVARFYQLGLSSYVKEKMHVKDKRTAAAAGYVLCWYSYDGVGTFADSTPPVITPTPPPSLPRFSGKPVADKGKAGKYLIVRKLKDSPNDMDYFIDFAMMAALPQDYLPETLEGATRIVVIDCRWVKGGKFHDGPDIYVAHNSITIFDAASGTLVAKVADYREQAPVTAMIKKGTKKYYAGVDKDIVCQKVVAWLEKGKKK